MTYLRTTQVADEPILICTYRDRVTVDDVQGSRPHIEALSMNLQSDLVFLIIDTTEADATFQDMLQVLRMPDINPLTETHAPPPFDLQLIMVGTDVMVKFYVNAIQQKQYGGQAVPLFAHLDDAVDAARTAIRTHSNVNTPHAAGNL